MVFNCSYTKRAENDLDDLLNYLVNTLQNKNAAIEFLSAFEEKMQILCAFPESAPVVQNSFIKFYEIRRTLLNKYLIYYYIDEKVKTIYVLTIRHSLEDQERIIKGL